MCHGGPGVLFGKSTNSFINTGACAARCYNEGCIYANGEFIQVHPTAIPGEDKLRLISESVRGEGGRIWTYKNGKPWYFLEEKYPKYGNLVPRDIASREIFDVCVNQGLGVEGRNMVYLDVRHLPAEVLKKVAGVLEIYEKFMGVDPRTTPMQVFPAVHYSMGGLWIDDHHRTNVPGVYAVGEADYHYHGANRLGANSLLSCLFGGMVAGPDAVQYVKGVDKPADAFPETLFTDEARRQREIYDAIMRQEGPENPYRMVRELGELMTNDVTIVRYNDRLRRADQRLQEMKERCRRIAAADTSRALNQFVLFTRQMSEMIDLARVIALSALARDESRGSHYKPEFPARDDERFLKTTMAKAGPDGPVIYYEDVNTSLIKPRERKY
jgi:succinate dehydrogenase / fumarate reductase flavoprotein subunit